VALLFDYIGFSSFSLINSELKLNFKIKNMRQILVKHIRRWTLQSLTPKSARSLKGRDFLLRKKRDALNCPLDFFVMLLHYTIMKYGT
jgi:hypothetical protein